jgi:hypothetical protein
VIHHQRARLRFIKRDELSRFAESGELISHLEIHESVSLPAVHACIFLIFTEDGQQMP